MPKYLIKLTPLEPYFFGGERTFGFGMAKGQVQKYYIVSEKVPSQTTLFGTLRYIILSQNKALIGEENAAEAANYVGAGSFSFDKAMKNENQGFGKINCISPLFLTNGVKWLVPTPYNHNPGDKNNPNKKYTPFTMAEIPVISGNGFMIYPEDFKTKNGYGGGYISLSDLNIVKDDDIFLTDVRTGINSHRTEDTTNGIEDDGSFFKKERKMLKKGYSFAFIAELSEEMKCTSEIVFMGQDKSPFRYEIEETAKDLTDCVKNAFENTNCNALQYALSDIMPLSEQFSPGDGELKYYIADTKALRNLKTVNYGKKYYHARLEKSEKLYKLMRSGSVFFTEKDLFENQALRKIGLNIIVELKGEK